MLRESFCTVIFLSSRYSGAFFGSQIRGKIRKKIKDFLAIQHKSQSASSIIFTDEIRLSGVELLSLLRKFENSTRCIKISFDLDSSSNSKEIYFQTT